MVRRRQAAASQQGTDNPARGTPDHVTNIARESVAAWLEHIEAARDAKLRSGLLGQHESDELRLASGDLHLSWGNFDKLVGLLMSRFGEDELVKLALAAMIAEYLRGIGAAGIVSKLCGLPTLSDIRAVNKIKAKRARSVLSLKPEKHTANDIRQLTLELARPLWDADEEKDGKFRYRKKPTAVANYIYKDFCHKVRHTIDLESHWMPPNHNKGHQFEAYRSKMINAIRWSFVNWLKERDRVD